MRFKEFGNRGQSPTILLIHGLFVSWELFNPLVERLQGTYHIIVPMLDGHIYDDGKSEKSCFTTIDAAAQEIAAYLGSIGCDKVHLLYGISLGGGIAARFAEMGAVPVENLIIDAGPILPYGKLFTEICAYYQAANCWCTYHFRRLYKMLFPSHYIRYAIDEVAKTFPSGGVRTPINVYRSLFAYRLQHISEETKVAFWYGSKEAWVMKRCADHLQTLRPDAAIEVLPRMQHAQLIIDHPDTVAEKIEIMSNIIEAPTSNINA